MSESEVKKAIEILMAAGYSRPQASIVAEAILQWLEARRYMREGVLVQDEKTGLPISNPAARAMAAAQKVMAAAADEYPAEVEAAFRILEEAMEAKNGGTESGGNASGSVGGEESKAGAGGPECGCGTPVPSGRSGNDDPHPMDGADKRTNMVARTRKGRKRIPEFLRR